MGGRETAASPTVHRKGEERLAGLSLDRGARGAEGICPRLSVPKWTSRAHSTSLGPSALLFPLFLPAFYKQTPSALMPQCSCQKMGLKTTLQFSVLGRGCPRWLLSHLLFTVWLLL